MEIKDRSKDVIVSSMDTWKFFDAQSDERTLFLNGFSQ